MHQVAQAPALQLTTTAGTDSEGPLYAQIKRALKLYIADRKLPAHAALPSYRELCAWTGASRITVRRAVSDLCAEGVLYTLAGKGTFVAEIGPSHEMTPFVGMTDEFAHRRQVVTSLWLERGLTAASGQLSALLNVAVGTELVKLSRLRICDNKPMAIQTVYLPHAACPGLLDGDLVDGSLYRTLRQRYALHLASARTTIYARVASPTEAELLQAAMPAPLLCTRQLTYDAGHRPVEWALSAFLAGSYELSMSHERALVPGQRTEF